MAAGVKTDSRNILSKDFTRFLLECSALSFGDFTLKSGRKSPYFINAGSFNDGSTVSRLGSFYAQAIRLAIEEGLLNGDFDTVFGPAYKGIPLAVSTAIALAAHGQRVGYTFDRKEAKDHGDGGLFVGTQLTDGMKVLLVDDVMTAGTAVRTVIPKIQSAAHVTICGLILSVDRMEKAIGSDRSALDLISQEFGFPVIPIATIQQVLTAARTLKNDSGNPVLDDLHYSQAVAYLEKYGA